MNRRRRLHGRKRRSAFTKGGRGWDRLQTGLSFAGLIFPQADALNAAISSTRAGYAKWQGRDEDYKKHRNAALINTAAIVPGVGELYKGSKAGKVMVQGATKQADDIYKVVKGLGGAGDVIGAVGNIGYWKGTADQIKDDISGGYKEKQATEVGKNIPKPNKTIESAVTIPKPKPKPKPKPRPQIVDKKEEYEYVPQSQRG